jgi:predicted nucleic-acid-binding Zn-ribbon protein
MFTRFLFEKLDLDSFFSSIERSEKRFCPNCGSKEVEPDERHTNNLGEVIFDLNKWMCNDCGYTGIMPLEDNECRNDIDFEPVEQGEIDASAGRGLLKYYSKIMIPSLIVAYLIFRLIFG